MIEESADATGELAWAIHEDNDPDPDEWPEETEPPKRLFDIEAAAVRGSMHITLSERSEYPDGLYFEDILNWKTGVQLTKRNFVSLIAKILECLDRAGKEKLYAHAQNRAVERLLNRLGAVTADHGVFDNMPLRILARTQLESALQTLSQ